MTAPRVCQASASNSRLRSSSPNAHSWSRWPSSPRGSSGRTPDAVTNPSRDMLMSKITLVMGSPPFRPAFPGRAPKRSVVGMMPPTVARHELRRIPLPRRWVNRDVWSAHRLELVQLPALVEPCLQRSVEAEEREPRLAGERLDPVVLLALWCPRTEVQIVGAVLVNLQRAGVAGQGGPDRRRHLDEGAGLGVVDVDGPEVLGRRVGIYPQAVRLAPVEDVPVGVVDS